jgi:hypothetical protein
MTFAVIVIASSVRPWNAFSKTTGRGARDLDRVLDRLGARVHEDRALLAVAARRELREALADVHERLVRPDHEALVQVAVGLRLDRLDDRGVAVARVLAADAACEVDERASVHVGHARALRLGDDEPRRRHPRSHVPRAFLGYTLGGGLLAQ